MPTPVGVELSAYSSGILMSRGILDGTPFHLRAAFRAGLAPSEGRFSVLLIVTEQGAVPLVVPRIVAVVANHIVEVGLGLSRHGSAAASYLVVVGVSS